jgi:hypothetical protein
MFKIPFIVPPHTLRSSMWSLTFRFPHQNSVCISVLSQMCHVPRPFHPWSDHRNIIWWTAQIMKLLILQFCPLSCHLLPRRPKYCPHHLVQQLPPNSSQTARPCKTSTTAVLCILIAMLLDSQRQDKGSACRHVTGPQPGAQTDVPQSAATSCRIQQCWIDWRLLFFVDKGSIKIIHNVPFGYSEVTLFRCISHNTFNFNTQEHCTHVSPVLLNYIPKRQMSLFFMHPLCSFRDMESEAKERAHPCLPPPRKICKHFLLLRILKCYKKSKSDEPT